MSNISRKISRSVSRIISRGLGSTVVSYFARFFTTASTWVGELLKSSVGDLTLEPTGRWCFEGDGTGYLTFVGLSAYDSITVNRQGVGEEAITLTGGNWTPSLGESYNDVKFYDGATLVHHFPLDNFKPGSTPSVVEYPDKIGGAKATLVNGAPAVNLSARTDVGRSNNLLGFSQVININSGYYNLGTIHNVGDTGIYIFSVWLKTTSALFNVFNNTGGSSVNQGYSLDVVNGRPSFYISGSLKLVSDIDDAAQIDDGEWHNIEYLIDRDNDTVTRRIDGSISGSITDISGVGDITGDFQLRIFTPYFGFLGDLRLIEIEDDSYIIDNQGNLVNGANVYQPSGTVVPYSLSVVQSSGLDTAGLPPTNPAINNGLGYNGCEQTYRCPDMPKEKDSDDIWKSADGLTVNDVNVGTLNDGDNGNIEIVKDAQGNVSDLKIK